MVLCFMFFHPGYNFKPNWRHDCQADFAEERCTRKILDGSHWASKLLETCQLCLYTTVTLKSWSQSLREKGPLRPFWFILLDAPLASKIGTWDRSSTKHPFCCSSGNAAKCALNMHPNNSQHALNCCCYFRSLRTSLHCLATLRWPLLAWPLACTSLHEPLYGVMIVVVAFKSGWTILIIILNLNVPLYIDCSSQIMSRVLQILPELLLYTRISGVLVDGNDNESSQPANFHEEAVWTCGIAV